MLSSQGSQDIPQRSTFRRVQEGIGRLLCFRNTEPPVDPVLTYEELGKTQLRIYLPKNKFVIIKKEPGLRLEDALKWHLEIRNLSTDMCNVHTSKQPTSFIIPWDTLISHLGLREAWVLVHKKGRLIRYRRHNFETKTFYNITFCKPCRRFLFRGLFCDQCLYTSHWHCVNRIRPNCEYYVSSDKYARRIREDSPDLEESSPAVEDRTDLKVRSAPDIFMIHPVLTKRERSLADLDCDQKVSFYFRSEKSMNGTQPIKLPERRSRSFVTQRRLPESCTKDDLRRVKDSWNISGKLVKKVQLIGTGSFGAVYKSCYCGPVALKVLKVQDPTPKQLYAFRNEIEMLWRALHDNIVLYLGYVTDPELGIVTQWCDNYTLHKSIHVDEYKFKLSLLINICRQISEGMEYLHHENIIHRDLKSSNIFLVNDFQVKIGDFGMACLKDRWNEEYQRKQPYGSVLWMAPEVIRMQEDFPYSFKSDVYSFGIVMYELLSQSLPYNHINNSDQILYMVGKGYLRPDLSKVRDDCPEILMYHLDNCIKFDRHERPDFLELLVSLEELERAIRTPVRRCSLPAGLKTELRISDLA